MRTDKVELWSEGARQRGWLHRPDDAARRSPFVVQGPGWLGLADAKLYQPYHEAFTSAGFAVLIFDYRGFGESEGERDLSPAGQIEDWRNAIAYMRAREDMDPDGAAIFGSGGTGGGNAVAVAALEPAVRASISQVPVADGRDWLRRMRATEDDWTSFLASVEADRRARASHGRGTVVHPRQGIMVESAERRATTVKADVDARIPSEVPLAAAQRILDYRPIDLAARVRGLMIVAVEDDGVTPTDHAVQLYEAAQAPKRLVLQHGTTHYAAYKQYAGEVIPQIVEWLRALVLGEGDARGEGVRHVGRVEARA
jgi:hypothetical protein